MQTRGKHPRSLRRALGVVAVIALVATACDPGKVTPVAGTGAAGSTGDGGPATSATFEKPAGVVAIPSGGYYVTDTTACVIRKIDAAGTITTIAGTGTCGTTGDGGPATSAEIRPTTIAQGGQLALDDAGDVFFANGGGIGASPTIRRIDPSGTITTISDDGTSTCGVITSTILPYLLPARGSRRRAGRLGVRGLPLPGRPHRARRHQRRRLPGTGPGPRRRRVGHRVRQHLDRRQHAIVGTLNGDGTLTTLVDVTAATGDPYLLITHLAVDGAGNLYGASGPADELVGSSYNTTRLFPLPTRNAVYRLGAGTVTTIAGDGQPDPATAAQTGHGYQLSVSPTGITVDDWGDLLVTSGHVVYRIADAADAALWDGTACNPSTIHPGADLSGADLHDQNLHGCDFTGTNLTGANLAGADLGGATFVDTTVTGADLTGADLTGATSHGIIGSPAALPTGWTVAHGLLLGASADFHLTDLSGADLTGLDLSGLDFNEANLTGADFTGADLSGADLSGAQVSADFTGANLTGADLTYTQGSPNFTDADLTNVVTSGVFPDAQALPPNTGYNVSAAFTDADLSGATLTGADLSAVSTASCTGLRSGGIVGTPTTLPLGWTLRSGFLVCSGANLTGADLSGQDLSGMYLTNIDLTGADLTGADLTSSSLGGASLDGTALAGRTSPPPTSPPPAAPPPAAAAPPIRPPPALTPPSPRHPPPASATASRASPPAAETPRTSALAFPPCGTRGTRDLRCGTSPRSSPCSP